MNKNTPNNRKNLLEELDNLRGLLGDETADVSVDNLPVLGDSQDSDDRIPLLKTREENQLPLLEMEPAPAPRPASTTTARTTTTSPGDLKQTLASRANPFLKNAEAAIAARDAAVARDTAKAAAPQAKGMAEPARATPPLSEAQINRLVDDVLKECLPHIEQTLRIHLNAALHRQNRNN